VGSYRVKKVGVGR